MGRVSIASMPADGSAGGAPELAAQRAQFGRRRCPCSARAQPASEAAEAGAPRISEPGEVG